MVSTRSVAGTGVRARRNRADDVAGLGRARAGVFVAPALLMIGMFLLFPAIWTIYLGMTDFRLTGLAAAHTSFVGLGNFTTAFGDKAFWNALQLTVVFVALSGVIGQSLLGFSLAWSLRRLKGWVRTLVESLALAAWVIPGSVNAFLWIALLDRRDGTLNTLLNTPGTAWLISYPMAMIVIFNIWVGTAFSMQLFSSALSSVSPSQLESAQIAGASEFRQLFDIVLPTIKGHILTNTLMITLWTFNTFTPFLLTAGGPNRKTEIFSVYIYKSAIGSGRLGFGAAISMIMLLINLAIALLYMRVGRKK